MRGGQPPLNLMIALPEEALRPPLPAMPEWFPRALENISRHGEKPLFRVVNGLTELHFRRGKWTLKHLLQHDGIPCYFPVVKTRYRRKNVKTGAYEMYTTFEAAKKAKDHDLSIDIETATIATKLPVGRACWVVEVYVKPEEIDALAWEANRFGMAEKNRIAQKIDFLGPFPTEGYYIACFDVVDADGTPVSPSDKTLEECKRRLRSAENDSRSLEACIQGAIKDSAEFEKKELERLNDNFYQWAGITANRGKGGVIAKPIH